MSKTMNGAIIVIIILLLGGWYWYSHSKQVSEDAAPTGSLGINGSPNQGNLGQQSNGQVQQPQGDGTDVTQNLLLGISADAKLGNYLTAYNGMTVYMYAKDGANTSSCTGACAQTWPPYTVPSKSNINIPAGIDQSKIAVLTRADGSLQIMYDKHPLYFYKNDAKPGDTTGQGVGGNWYVVQP